MQSCAFDAMNRLFLCVITAALTSVWGERPSDRAHRDCAVETDLDPTLTEGNRWLETQNDPVYKEYILCFCRKMDFLDERGDFRKDVMRAALAPLFAAADHLEAVVDKCVVKKSSLRESAYETIKCIDVNIPRPRLV